MRDDGEAARGHLYAVLGALLARPPAAELLARVARVEGGSGRVGTALAGLAAAAAAVGVPEARREHDRLFIGVVRGELVPYASYYLTGFLHEKPLARLRRDLARLGIARAPGTSDPEDHIAAVCEAMALLAGGGGEAPRPLATQRSFFQDHLRPWAGRFFGDLERIQGAPFYSSVGAVGAAFLAVEEEAFTLAPDDGVMGGQHEQCR